MPHMPPLEAMQYLAMPRSPTDWIGTKVFTQETDNDGDSLYQ
jgi:hypothetical protein